MTATTRQQDLLFVVGNLPGNVQNIYYERQVIGNILVCVFFPGVFTKIKGVLGWLLVVVLFAPSGRVIRDLFRLLDAVYDIVRKH